MGAIEALGEKGSHPEGRAEAPQLPFFIWRKWSDGRNSGSFLFWSFACALKILRILSAFQGIVLVGALLSLLTSSATKPGSGSWGVQFLSPPLRWHASLGDELGQSTRSVHRRWCQLRPQVTINVPCSQVNATETTPTLGTGQTTCRGMAGVLINTFY